MCNVYLKYPCVYLLLIPASVSSMFLQWAKPLETTAACNGPVFDQCPAPKSISFTASTGKKSQRQMASSKHRPANMTKEIPLSTSVSFFLHLHNQANVTARTDRHQMNHSPMFHYHLVGGFEPSEKYEFVNWDDDSIPNSHGKIIQSCSRKTSNQPCFEWQLPSKNPWKTHQRPSAGWLISCVESVHNLGARGASGLTQGWWTRTIPNGHLRHRKSRMMLGCAPLNDVKWC